MVPKNRKAELVRPPKTPRLVPAIGPSPPDTVATSHLLNTSLSSAFETPHLGLLVAKGFINSHPCEILFDNGAEIIYLSHRLAKQLQVETTAVDQHATFADGTSAPLHQTVVPVNFKIEGYSESLYLAVCPLSSYDVILGNQWLSKYDPWISDKTNKITFHFGNRPIRIQADLERYKSLVSESTWACAIRRGYHTFALLLNPGQPSKTPTVSTRRVKTLLEEFSDVFPDDLLKGLTPQRSHDFKIELQPDAAPVKKGLCSAMDFICDPWGYYGREVHLF
jgi:Retroviral aspartyl protease